MYLRIEKWGKYLALRIPAQFVQVLGLKNGDRVQLRLTADGGLSVSAAKWDRQAFAQELKAIHEAMPMTASVIEELRRKGRY